jgi:hypothetical protein
MLTIPRPTLNPSKQGGLTTALPVFLMALRQQGFRAWGLGLGFRHSCDICDGAQATSLKRPQANKSREKKKRTCAQKENRGLE